VLLVAIIVCEMVCWVEVFRWVDLEILDRVLPLADVELAAKPCPLQKRLAAKIELAGRAYQTSRKNRDVSNDLSVDKLRFARLDLLTEEHRVRLARRANNKFRL
jgi:hypothetical protein